MKWSLTISLFLLITPAFAQEDPAMLAKQLTDSHKTELGKVTAIFNWITQTISYKTNTGKKKIIGSSTRRNFNEEVEDNSPLKPLNERVAETVLKKRVAVCDGYARLFTLLCDFAGIRSEIIAGYAKTNSSQPSKRFQVNHYWNAVMIDTQWHLLDVTWASGYLSARGDEFIRELNNNYFLTPPEIFIRDHYPDDARWTLLPDSKTPEEFRQSPFKQKSFVKYHITSFFPSVGVIEAFVGDTIRLRVETASTEKGRQVCPDLLIDSAIFSHSPTWVFLRPDIPEKTTLHNFHDYVYPVASPSIEWLYLVYNDDLVLRYRINIKKKKT